MSYFVELVLIVFKKYIAVFVLSLTSAVVMSLSLVIRDRKERVAKSRLDKPMKEVTKGSVHFQNESAS